MAKKGPTKGGRWLVELPFGKEVKAANNKPGKSKLVRIKQGVAKYFGWKSTRNLPKQTVSMKTAAGEKNVTRTPRVGAGGGRSVVVHFENGKSIGGKTVKSVSVPLGTGCTNHDAITYFRNVGKGVIGMTTTSGRKVIWGDEK